MTLEMAADVNVVEKPDISHIVTEDDKPVDNIFSAEQERQRAERLAAQLRALGVDPEA